MVDEWSESKQAGRYFFCPFIKKGKLTFKNFLLNPPPLSLLQLSFNKFPVHTRTHLDS